MTTRIGTFAIIMLLPVFALTGLAGAQTPEARASFYNGKTVRFIVGFAPGGGFDLITRLIARHFSGYVAGQPRTLVQNMPGGGGLVSANYIYNVAKADGLTVGFFSSTNIFEELIGSPGVKFETKRFQWIGSAGSDTVICLARHDSGFKTISDVIESPKPLVVGSSGRGSNMSRYPRALNALLRTNFEIVEGYAGAAPVRAAMDRGEVEGQCVFWTAIKGTRPDWVPKGFVRVLLQVGLEKHPEHPDVPWVMDLVKDPDDRLFLEALIVPSRMAWPYFVAPGVPRERVKILREAFLKTVTDPAFLREAERAQQEIRPSSGEEVQSLVEKVFASPPAILNRIAEILK
jgi:tripartite-type tricarboxylate transporter receptor subunit TctC